MYNTLRAPLGLNPSTGSQMQQFNPYQLGSLMLAGGMPQQMPQQHMPNYSPTWAYPPPNYSPFPQQQYPQQQYGQGLQYTYPNTGLLGAGAYRPYSG